MKRLLLLVVFILSCGSSEAQADRSVFGVGALAGYNSVYGNVGLSGEVVFFSHLDINVGLATRHYQGAGFSVGTRYYPLGIKYFSPLIGVNVMMMNGRTFSVEHNGFFTIYSTPKNQYVVSEAGVLYNCGQVDLLLLASYSLANFEVHTRNESGVADPAFMTNIDEKINGGVGFTLGIMFRPWKIVPAHKTEFETAD